MYPNTLSSVLSRMLLILYSKFCAATSGLSSARPSPAFPPVSTVISPQAPPTFEFRSKLFHRL